jgi:hypothetical protein
MIIGIGHNNVFIHTKAKPMRRIELPFARPKLTKLAPSTATKLHIRILKKTSI